jgi:hypothetical protein
MLLSPFFVNAFRVLSNTISTIFMSFVSKWLRLSAVHPLWIKRVYDVLFLSYWAWCDDWRSGRVRLGT